MPNMGPDTRKPVFGVCKQQRPRPACTSAQSDQRLCFSLTGKYHIQACYKQTFKILACLCNCAGWFWYDLIKNTKDRFSSIKAHINGEKYNIFWMTSAFSTDFPRAYFRTLNICNFLISEQIHIVLVLLDFSLTVKAATLIVISRCGSAISSAKQGEIRFYL